MCTAALVQFAPAVDLQRERSLIVVRPSVGNSEKFHINLPFDRIFAGSRTGDTFSTFPAAAKWPDIKGLDGAASEVFKLRNSNDVVVGIAARISSSSDVSGRFIQWMLHLPARGSMFAEMQPGLSEGGYRDGLFVVGTREFENMNGTVQEYFDTDVAEGISGRLELRTSLTGKYGDEE